MKTPGINLTKLLDLPGFSVASFRIENNTIWIKLRRDKRHHPICFSCGKKTKRIHDRQQRTVRDLACFGLRTYLEYETVRVHCERCEGTHQERLDWLADNPRYTKRFACQVARLCFSMSILAVARFADIAWHSARGLMEGVAQRFAPAMKPPVDLRYIGIDEKSWRRGRRFCTIVSDLQTGRVIWICEGRSQRSLDSFFAWLGTDRCDAIEAVAIDLAPAYEAAVRAHCPRAAVVFDRYHVIKLLLEALNGVRKQVVRLASDDQRPFLTDKKWLLLSHEQNLPSQAKAQLDALLLINRPLALAHILKEDFLRLYEFSDENEAGQFLVGWIDRAIASGLKPLQRFAAEVANRFDGFLGHIRHRIPMGVVEAINSKLEGLIYRARGFRNVKGFIATALFICGQAPDVISDRKVFAWSL